MLKQKHKKSAVILIRAWNLPLSLKVVNFFFPKTSRVIVLLWQWVENWIGVGWVSSWCEGLTLGWASAGHLQGVTSSLRGCPAQATEGQKADMRQLDSGLAPSQAGPTSKTVGKRYSSPPLWRRGVPWEVSQPPGPDKGDQWRRETQPWWAPCAQTLVLSSYSQNEKWGNWGSGKEPPRQVCVAISHFSKRQPVCWKWNRNQPQVCAGPSAQYCYTVSS